MSSPALPLRMSFPALPSRMLLALFPTIRLLRLLPVPLIARLPSRIRLSSSGLRVTVLGDRTVIGSELFLLWEETAASKA